MLKETQEQIFLVEWIDQNYPNLLFTASAGGMRTSIGTAIKMKRMGYRKGTPDIMIFESNMLYKALFIELKREKGGVVSLEQKEWIENLNKRGYLAVVCRGAEAAKGIIKAYNEQAK